MKKIYKHLLPQSKEVLATQVKVEGNELIVEVEFKEQFRPKDGDFLFSRIDSLQTSAVFIFSKFTKNEHLGCYCAVQYFDDDRPIWHIIPNENFSGGCGLRLATKKEKADFLKGLEKEFGKRWNAEKKCLEDIFNPKDGDFVSTKDGRVFIHNGRGTEFQYGAYCGVNTGNKIIINDPLLSGWTGQNGCRFATEEEKQNFLDRLEIELGKRWNAETKQLEDTLKATADIPREKVFKLKDGYMIIPFNVEIARDIQEGRREGYICTRKQHLPVRVICWDSKYPDDYPTPSPIVALVMWYGLESPGCYQENGYWGKKEGKNDLVLAVPEREK